MILLLFTVNLIFKEARVGFFLWYDGHERIYAKVFLDYGLYHGIYYK